MAIDPSISLGFKPPVQLDASGAIGRGISMAGEAMKPALYQAEINQSNQQTQNLAAQHPGIVAQSQQQQTSAETAARDLSINKLMGANGDKFQTNDPVSGAPTVDYPKLTSYLQGIGAGDKFPEVAKSYLETSKKVIGNSTDQNTLNNNQYSQGLIGAGIVAQRINKQVDDGLTTGEIQQNYTKTRQGLIDHLGTGVINDSTMPENPRDIKEWARVTAAGSITPEQNIINKQTDSQIQIAQQGAEISKQSMLQNGASVSQTMGGLKQNADNEFANSSFYTTGASMANKIFGPSGLGMSFDAYKANILGDTAYAPYVAAVAKYNTENGTTYKGNEAGMKDLLLESGMKHHITGQGFQNTYGNMTNPQMSSVPQRPIAQQNTNMPQPGAQPETLPAGSYQPVTADNFNPGGPKLALPPKVNQAKGLNLTANGQDRGMVNIIRISDNQHGQIPVSELGQYLASKKYKVAQ